MSTERPQHEQPEVTSATTREAGTTPATGQSILSRLSGQNGRLAAAVLTLGSLLAPKAAEAQEIITPINQTVPENSVHVDATGPGVTLEEEINDRGEERLRAAIFAPPDGHVHITAHCPPTRNNPGWTSVMIAGKRLTTNTAGEATVVVEAPPIPGDTLDFNTVCLGPDDNKREMQLRVTATDPRTGGGSSSYRLGDEWAAEPEQDLNFSIGVTSQQPFVAAFDPGLAGVVGVDLPIGKSSFVGAEGLIGSRADYYEDVNGEDQNTQRFQVGGRALMGVRSQGGFELTGFAGGVVLPETDVQGNRFLPTLAAVQLGGRLGVLFPKGKAPVHGLFAAEAAAAKPLAASYYGITGALRF